MNWTRLSARSSDSNPAVPDLTPTTVCVLLGHHRQHSAVTVSPLANGQPLIDPVPQFQLANIQMLTQIWRHPASTVFHHLVGEEEGGGRGVPTSSFFRFYQSSFFPFFFCWGCFSFIIWQLCGRLLAVTAADPSVWQLNVKVCGMEKLTSVLHLYFKIRDEHD